MDKAPRKQSVIRWFLRSYLGRIAILLSLIGVICGGTTVVLSSLHEAAIERSLQNTKVIGLGFYNYMSTFRCLPEIEAGEKRHFGWRVSISHFIDAHRIPTDEEIRSMPAYIFNLSGWSNPNNQSTTIYAIVGDKTAFGIDNQCRFFDLPESTLLLISGRASKGPWHSAENASLEEFKVSTAVRDVVGETCTGVAFILFRNGDVWAIDSSVPSELIARCAEVSDAAESGTAQQALLKYRLKGKK